MRQEFKDQLVKSGYIHTLLPLDLKNSTENRLLSKDVTKTRDIFPSSPDGWITEGVGNIEQVENRWILISPARIEPKKAMNHYTPYGYFHAGIRVEDENWYDYNRVVFKIRPKCNGLHSPLISVHLCNDGEVKIPDVYNREGKHSINLQNNME